MKKLSLFFALTLCMSLTIPAAAYSPSFTDVSETHWAYSSIENMAAAGIVIGRGNEEFDPNGSVTTGEMIKILVSAYYPDEIASKTATDSNWWNVYMQVAQEKGLLTGTAAGSTYNNRTWASSVVNAPMTRADAAMVIYRLFQSDFKAYTPDPEDILVAQMKLPDADQYDVESLEAISTVYAGGIVTSMDETMQFYGNSNLSRAQIAVILERVMITTNNSSYLNRCVYPTTTLAKPDWSNLGAGAMVGEDTEDSANPETAENADGAFLDTVKETLTKFYVQGHAYTGTLTDPETGTQMSFTAATTVSQTGGHCTVTLTAVPFVFLKNGLSVDAVYFDGDLTGNPQFGSSVNSSDRWQAEELFSTFEESELGYLAQCFLDCQFSGSRAEKIMSATQTCKDGLITWDLKVFFDSGGFTQYGASITINATSNTVTAIKITSTNYTMKMAVTS